jgi:hypothetical protein
MRAMLDPRRDHALAVALALSVALSVAPPAAADAVYQLLPLQQDWTNAGMFGPSDDWSAVPGIVGYRGALGAPTTDPRTLTWFDSGDVTVVTNRHTPGTLLDGGVAAFTRLSDPVVALRGSATAGAPHLRLHLSTAGYERISVAYVLRDVDTPARDAVQPFVMQYRIGTSGPWTSLEDTYVADASAPPLDPPLVTAIETTLPAECDDRPELQIRVITVNGPGDDRWIGVDDLRVRGIPLSSNPIGANLSWEHCGTDAGTAERSFGCDDNTASFSLVGSFRPGVALAGFVGISAILEVRTAATTLPDWFSFGLGACRDGAIAMRDVRPLSHCTNPYFGAYQGGGFAVESTPGAAGLRFRIDWARDVPGQLDASTLYSAFLLAMGSDRSFDEGQGSCAGCQVSALFELKRVEAYSATTNQVLIVDIPDVRSWAGWQGGSALVTGVTPARRSSWGQVKALYR